MLVAVTLEKNLAKATKVLQFISASSHRNTAVMLKSVQKRMGFCSAFRAIRYLKDWLYFACYLKYFYIEL